MVSSVCNRKMPFVESARVMSSLDNKAKNEWSLSIKLKTVIVDGYRISLS